MKVELKDFLSHIVTKCELTIYLSIYLAVALESANKEYCIVYETHCKTNISDFHIEMLEHNQQEADTIIILHSIVDRSFLATSILTILSPDTDVFLVLIYFYPNLCTSTIFRTGKKINVRDIDIGRCFDALEPKRAKSLLGFHAFTGCDMAGKFRGRSKAFCWKIFLQSDNKVLDSFFALGSREINPTDCFVVDGLVKYVMKLYCSGCPADIDNLGKLRWFMLSKYQTESEKNPPMLGAFIFKILRSHYISLVWRTCDEPKPSLPSSCEFGSRSNNDSYQVVTTKELPAPEALIELIFCGCTTKCKNN